MSTRFIGYAGLALLVGAMFVIVYTLGRQAPTVTPDTGRRGLKRKQALARSPLFKAFDPATRLVASWIAQLPLGKVRQKLDMQLLHAGCWLGVTPDELLALSVLSGTGFLAIGLVAVNVGGLAAPLAILFAGLGAILPHARMTGELQDRFTTINRTLPTAIDLVALCMGAGLDFPRSLRQVVEKEVARADNPLNEEIYLMLQEMELGRTRKQALQNFAFRVPTEPVQDFTGSVIQAEEKGNPLADVLRIQATMLRLRRSIMSEERSAKAAVAMMAPMLLIMVSVLLILMGPFIVTAVTMGGTK